MKAHERGNGRYCSVHRAQNESYECLRPRRACRLTKYRQLSSEAYMHLLPHLELTNSLETTRWLTRHGWSFLGNSRRQTRTKVAVISQRVCFCPRDRGRSSACSAIECTLRFWRKMRKEVISIFPSVARKAITDRGVLNPHRHWERTASQEVLK